MRENPREGWMMFWKCKIFYGFCRLSNWEHLTPSYRSAIFSLPCHPCDILKDYEKHAKLWQLRNMFRFLPTCICYQSGTVICRSSKSVPCELFEKLRVDVVPKFKNSLRAINLNKRMWVEFSGMWESSTCDGMKARCIPHTFWEA